LTILQTRLQYFVIPINWSVLYLSSSIYLPDLLYRCIIFLLGAAQVAGFWLTIIHSKSRDWLF
jgi:hypothetical protein